MMTASLILVIPILCLVVAICAFLGDRITRHGHRVFGMGINLCGYAALVTGVLLVISWMGLTRHHIRVHIPHVTVLRHVSQQDSVTVRGHANDDRVKSEDRAVDRGTSNQPTGTGEEKGSSKQSVPENAATSDQPAKSADRAVDRGTSNQPTGTGEEKGSSKQSTPENAATAKPVASDSGQAETKKEDAPAATGARGPEPTSARDLELMPHAFIDFDARPEWVESKEEDLGPVHRIAVCSGPFLRVREARDELSKQLKIETDRYINKLVDNPRAAAWLDYDETEIRARFVAPECFYDEKVVSPSFGVMQQSHALLQFGPDFRQEVQARWNGLVARGRLTEVGGVAAVILGILAILFGYFQLDTATRGFYTGRLRFAAAVAILGLIGASIFLARSIPWFWL